MTVSTAELVTARAIRPCYFGFVLQTLSRVSPRIRISDVASLHFVWQCLSDAPLWRFVKPKTANAPQ